MPVVSVVDPVTEPEPTTEGTDDTQPASSEPAQAENDNNGQSSSSSSPDEEQTEPGFEILLSGLALTSVYILFKRKN